VWCKKLPIRESLVAPRVSTCATIARSLCRRARRLYRVSKCDRRRSWVRLAEPRGHGPGAWAGSRRTAGRIRRRLVPRTQQELVDHHLYPPAEDAERALGRFFRVVPTSSREVSMSYLLPSYTQRGIASCRDAVFHLLTPY
jgi:hypothetical protein